MKKDKTKLWLITILTISLFGGAAMYGYLMVANKEVNFGNLISLILPILLVVFMIFFIIKRSKDVKQGMPLEDERSQKVLTLAAARAFYISLYWLLAISIFEPLFAKMFKAQHLDASQTVGGAIAGMALAWVLSWLYYDKKSDLV